MTKSVLSLSYEVPETDHMSRPFPPPTLSEQWGLLKRLQPAKVNCLEETL